MMKLFVLWMGFILRIMSSLLMDRSRKGKKKEIPAHSGRSRWNLSGAVDVLQHKVITQEDETLIPNML
jgi:hypothetical protein